MKRMMGFVMAILLVIGAMPVSADEPSVQEPNIIPESNPTTAPPPIGAGGPVAPTDPAPIVIENPDGAAPTGQTSSAAEDGDAGPDDPTTPAQDTQVVPFDDPAISSVLESIADSADAWEAADALGFGPVSGAPLIRPGLLNPSTEYWYPDGTVITESPDGSTYIWFQLNGSTISATYEGGEMHHVHIISPDGSHHEYTLDDFMDDPPIPTPDPAATQTASATAPAFPGNITVTSPITGNTMTVTGVSISYSPGGLAQLNITTSTGVTYVVPINATTQQILPEGAVFGISQPGSVPLTMYGPQYPVNGQTLNLQTGGSAVQGGVQNITYTGPNTAPTVTSLTIGGNTFYFNAQGQQISQPLPLPILPRDNTLNLNLTPPSVAPDLSAQISAAETAITELIDKAQNLINILTPNTTLAAVLSSIQVRLDEQQAAFFEAIQNPDPDQNKQLEILNEIRGEVQSIKIQLELFFS